MDSDEKTLFVSDGKPGQDDHFTLTFDKAVKLNSVELTTGRLNSEDVLGSGTLQISTDGKEFRDYARIAAGKSTDGKARTVIEAPAGKSAGEVRAIRIKPGELKHPLAIREIKIDSDPPVATFKYPVEFVLNYADAPELKDWLEKVARVCEREYAMINEELKSEGFRPPTVVTMTLRKDYKGVAYASGGRITGSVNYFKSHQDDIGAMVHETAHVVQQYRTRNNPGWLVEGVADYVRFFKYEPGKIGRLNPDRARHDASYRITAAFLNYVTEKYDKDLVKKLNKAMREGEYKPELWKQLTKKSVQELDEEWRASLKK